MDNTQEIFEYLPLTYKNPSDAEYFNFLVYSVEQNLVAENYHFAFLALHMIFMGIIYHYIYALYRADPTKFDNILIGFHDHMESRGKVSDFSDLSWHNFSVINEASIVQFFRSVGLEKGDIKEIKNLINRRNDGAHANGSFVASEEEFQEISLLYLNSLKNIHKSSLSKYKKLHRKFLRNIERFSLDDDEKEEYFRTDFVREYEANQKVIDNLSL